MLRQKNLCYPRQAPEHRSGQRLTSTTVPSGALLIVGGAGNADFFSKSKENTGVLKKIPDTRSCPTAPLYVLWVTLRVTQIYCCFGCCLLLLLLATTIPTTRDRMLCLEIVGFVLGAASAAAPAAVCCRLLLLLLLQLCLPLLP